MEVTSTKIDNMDAVAVEVPQEVPILVAAILILDQDQQRRRQQRREEEERRRRDARTPRRWWVRPWLQCLIRQMEVEDPESFRKMLRVEPDMFHELEERLQDRLHHRGQSISPGLQLAVTLKYLSTGVDYGTLMQGFLVSANSCSLIVRKVCKAIIDEYKDELVRTPRTAQEWEDVAKLCCSRWQFFNTLGAFDGKHIRVKKPANSGSEYQNYKGYFSVVLMALVDANYSFLWVEAGVHASQLKRRVEDGRLNFPDAAPLPGDNQPMPFFFIGDDAFALKSWMQKPYSRPCLDYQERVLNYHLNLPFLGFLGGRHI